MKNWTALAPVTSHGPSGIGFVNFGTIDRLDVRAPVMTTGAGARGFNLYGGSLRHASFDSIATTGDGAVGVQVSKPMPLLDKPAYRIEDVHGMADFIARYPGVDVARLGLLGICGGGGYSLKAAQTDKRLKSIATLSMFNSGRVRRNGYRDSQLSTIQERLQQASDARAQEAAGGEVLYSGDANMTVQQIAKLPFDLYRQGYEYYWKTHAHPGSTFKYTTSSLLIS